ncbi:MAG: hypothetical protein ACPGU1_02135 [Myxococcota bacterium]
MQDLMFMVRAGPDVGPGQVIVHDATGKELTRCDFQVTTPPTEIADPALSWATISQEVINDPATEHVRLRVGIVSAFGELIGESAPPEVQLIGGRWAPPLLPTQSGALSGDISAEADATQVSIIVEHSGALIEAFTLPVTLKTSEADQDSASGCESAPQPANPLGWFALLVLWSFRRARARENRARYADTR